MAHKFAEIAFTPIVRAIQVEEGSRAGYARMDDGDDYNHQLSGREAIFIAARDSFYMASVGETGWPYVQHRGGPTGFMKVLDERTIGFADYSGNRQYVSTGNFRSDNRVALFFMDYPNRTRLKMLGRVRTVDLGEPELLARLEDDDYPAKVERGFIIEVEGFDWNCPQHITPRFTAAQVEEQLASLPPFTAETAIEKVRLAEDAWNSRDPYKVSLAYTPDSRWRNRSEFPMGRDEIVALLTRKWEREREYRLIKELWSHSGNRIAVRFAYEWQDAKGSWYRSYGNENWEFSETGLMQTRHASINDLAIEETERLFRWPQGRRPDNHPGLSELGL